MMFRKLGIAAAGVTLIASLAACDFTADGHLECRTAADGKVTCTGSGTGVPTGTTTPPTTSPPTTTPPPVTEEPPPADPNAGLPGAVVQAQQSAANKVRVYWTTARTDITGWRVSRDGVDSTGGGAWGTDLPRATTDVTFDLLNPGATYRFTVVGKTAAENLPAVSKTVTLTSTTTPPVVDPPVVDPPTNPAGTTAAERFGWGAPVAAGSDEFNGTSIDGSKWNQPGECWSANDTVKGGRCASHNSVQDGYLRETGTADGKTGWVASKFGQKYGRWEVRARVITETPGQNYHPVLITWPDSDQFPQGGEYDYLELNSNSNHLEAFMHHPANTVVQTHYDGPNVDLSQWHNYGFEWSSTGLTGYIDGVQWFHHTKAGFSAPGPMHQTIQLDNFIGTSGMAKVHFDADWARAYPLR